MTQATNPLIYIPDHDVRGYNNLPSVFRSESKPNIEALVKALGAGTQALEDALFGLATGSRLDAATGAMLEVWGDLVGEPKGELEDVDYRRFIQARILVNRSAGTADDIARIAQIITADSVVRVEAYYPAELIVFVYRQSAMSDSVVARVASMMLECKSIGIKLQVIEAIGDFLGFIGNPDHEPMPVGTMARNVL